MFINILKIGQVVGSVNNMVTIPAELYQYTVIYQYISRVLMELCMLWKELQKVVYTEDIHKMLE